MSERKNIDRLFQERFKDFESAPPEETWSNIEARLDEKKKRRAIPIWWKFAGAAAILFVGFLIGRSYTATEMRPGNPVVAGNSTTNPQTQENKQPESNPAEPKPQKTAAGPAGDAVANSSAEKEKNGSIHTASGKEAIVKSDLQNYHSKANGHSSQNAVAENTKTPRHSLKNKRNPGKAKTAISESITEKESQIAVANLDKNKHKTQENGIVQTENKTSDPGKSNTIIDGKTIDLDPLKGASDSNTKIVTTETKVNDSVKKNTVATNELEELLKEKESKTTQQSKENRWQITSAVAPVFLGSVTNGSSIDPMFDNNSKNYNTNLSLGLGVSYALNNKISIRTGINKMAVDYDTNGIVFYADLNNNNGIATIDPTAAGKMIRVEDETAETTSLLPFENSFAHKNEGYINQKIGYYEVPMEVTYAVINKRFGVKIIGGVSTLFLSENKITVVSPNITSDLGKANNLSDVHFSTNLGLGLKYGFMKFFEFTVEPTIKYQLNTFNANAGNFKPYIFGVYSGISYKF